MWKEVTPAAIKQIFTTNMTEENVENFKRETELMKELKNNYHVNVLQVSDFP